MVVAPRVQQPAVDTGVLVGASEAIGQGQLLPCLGRNQGQQLPCGRAEVDEDTTTGGHGTEDTDRGGTVPIVGQSTQCEGDGGVGGGLVVDDQRIDADLAIIDTPNLNYWLYHFTPNACITRMGKVTSKGE